MGPRHSPPNTTMKQTSIHRIGALVAPLILGTVAFAAADAPSGADLFFGPALEQGKVSLNVRVRYEGVDQTGLQDADAFTIRTRLGYTTGPVGGLTAMFEAENIASPDPDKYSQAGLNPGGTGRAVVADPTGTEVNQAWLGYTFGDSALKVGRQNLVLDNARFIGNVGWRQNMQTFDAATLTNKSIDGLSLTYGYLYQVNRIFSARSAAGRFDSDSHVFNASYTGLPLVGTLTGYSYLLDFDNSAVNSTATYGTSLVGSAPIGDLKLGWRGEYAYQEDYRSNPATYEADYFLGELGLTFSGSTLAGGYEELGTDDAGSFKTPLATLHAFNGWADMFLGTPAGGLRDRYGKFSTTLPASLGLLVFSSWCSTTTSRRTPRRRSAPSGTSS